MQRNPKAARPDRRSEFVPNGREARLAALCPLHNSEMVATLVKSVRRKDLYTAAHMRAVAESARLNGLELELPPQELDDLFVGALLHDVGKIAILDAVLKKSDLLTPEEHALVRLHPSVGPIFSSMYGCSGRSSLR